MAIIEINTLNHPGVEVYGTLTEAQLRKRLEPDKGINIALEFQRQVCAILGVGSQPIE